MPKTLVRLLSPLVLAAATLTAVPCAQALQVIAESGVAQLDQQVRTIYLSRSYANPVAFALPLSRSEWDSPAVVQVVEITGNRLKLQIDPESWTTGASETVHYLVVEAGIWQLEGSGALLQAGKITTSASIGLRQPTQNWAQVTFPKPFAQAPVVLTQVQSTVNSDPLHTRQRNAAASGVQVALEPFEQVSWWLSAETVGWLAIQPGSGNWGTGKYVASRSEQVDDEWKTVYYQPACTSAWWNARFLGTLGSSNDRHAHLRFRNYAGTKCRLELSAEEDTTWDWETAHAFEQVDFLAIAGTGALRGNDGDLPPSADFSFQCAGLTCSFNASASADDIGIASYAWTFGNGTSGAGPTPSRSYGAGGSYTVRLTVTDTGGKTATRQKTVTVAENPPVAAFTHACSVLTCSFDGSGSSDDTGITSYQWSFGDGATGSGVTPGHTFPRAGTYPVTLTVADGAGKTDGETRQVTVSEAPPVANFSFQCSGLDCSFDGSSSSDDTGVTSWSWSFGDGSVGSGATTSHVFPAAGTYPTTLTVADGSELTGSYSLDVVLGLEAEGRWLLHPLLARGLGTDSELQTFGRRSPDAVDLLTGNLHLALPLGLQYPLREDLGYGFTLHYNSQVWDRAVTAGGSIRSLPVRTSNAGFGWELSFGRLLAPMAPENLSGLWVFVSPDGRAHPFHPTLHPGVPDADPGDTVSYTRDGTYLRMQAVSGSLRTVELPSGEVLEFAPDGDGWQLARLHDRRSNWLAFDRSQPGLWVLTDNHGRTHTVELQADPSGHYGELVSRLVLSAFGGTTAIYDFSYSTMDVTRDCGDTDPGTSVAVELPVLTAVTLPDGTRYDLGYHAGTGCREAGRLAELVLPTLGELRWTYGDAPYGNAAARGDLPAHLVTGTAVAGRSAVGADGSVLGSWSFGRTLATLAGGAIATSLDVAVTDPEGDVETSRFSVYAQPAPSGGWDRSHFGLLGAPASTARPTSGTVSDCQPGGTGCVLLRTFSHRWEQDASCTPADESCGNVARRRIFAGTEYLDDLDAAGVPRRTDAYWSDFDGLGNFRRQTSAATFGVADTLESYTLYNPAAGSYPGNFTMPAPAAPWVLDTYTAQWLTDGTERAGSEACFEAATGRLLRSRTWAGSWQGPNDLLQVFTYPAAGHAETAWYGGDVQPLPASPPPADLEDLSTLIELCTLPLPGPEQYRRQRIEEYGSPALTRFVDAAGNGLPPELDLDIDAATGLATVSRDVSGWAREHQYDALGRLVRSGPESGDGLVEERAYTAGTGAGWNGARVDVTRSAASDGTVLHRSLEIQDGFGHRWLSGSEAAGGATVYEVRELDARGRLVSETPDPVSLAEVDDPDRRVRYEDYDPFGRWRREVASDVTRTRTFRGAYQTTTQGRHAAFVDGTTRYDGDVIQVETYDARGRVIELRDERHHPWDSSQAPITHTTQYAYDLAGRVIESRRNGEPFGLSVRYDGRGVQVWSDDDGQAPLDHQVLAHDALGRVVRHVTPYGDLTSRYDRAGRLSVVEDTTDSSRRWIEYSYGETNEPGNQARGRLRQAIRHHRYPAGIHQYFAGDYARVTEEYTYGGPEGRLSAQRRTVSDVLGVRWIWNQAETRDELGDVTAITYPTCDFCDSRESPYPRQVHFDGGSGEATRVWEDGPLGNGFTWVNRTYGDAGELIQQSFANGTGETLTWASAGFARITAYSTLGYNYGNLSGDVEYDGTGAVIRIGDEWQLPSRWDWGVIDQQEEQLSIDPAELEDPCGRDPLGMPVATATAADCLFGEPILYDTENRPIHRIHDDLGKRYWYFYDFAGQLLRQAGYEGANQHTVALVEVTDSIVVDGRDVIQHSRVRDSVNDPTWTDLRRFLPRRAPSTDGNGTASVYTSSSVAAEPEPSLFESLFAASTPPTECQNNPSVPCGPYYGFVGGCELATELHYEDSCRWAFGGRTQPFPEHCYSACVSCCNLFNETDYGAFGTLRDVCTAWDLYQGHRDVDQLVIDLQSAGAAVGLLQFLGKRGAAALGLLMAAKCASLPMLESFYRSTCLAGCGKTFEGSGSCEGLDNRRAGGNIAVSGTPDGGPPRDGTCREWTYKQISALANLTVTAGRIERFGQYNRWHCTSRGREAIEGRIESCTVQESCFQGGRNQRDLYAVEYVCQVSPEDEPEENDEPPVPPLPPPPRPPEPLPLPPPPTPGLNPWWPPPSGGGGGGGGGCKSGETKSVFFFNEVSKQWELAEVIVVCS